jgi:hypothetical protein
MIEPGLIETGDSTMPAGLRRDYYVSPTVEQMIHAIGDHMAAIAQKLADELFPPIRLFDDDGYNQSAIIEASLVKLARDLDKGVSPRWSVYAETYDRIREEASMTQMIVSEDAQGAVQTIGRAMEGSGIPNLSKGGVYNFKLAVVVALIYCAELVKQ